MMPRRSKLSALLVLLATPLLSTLTGDPQPTATPAARPAAACPTQDKRDPNSAETCGQCHVDYYKEWQGARHAQAWTDPLYQAEVKEKRRPQTCWGCHIPESVHDRLGRKPKTRDELRHEGVNCVVCHKKGDDILGPFGAKTDAHPTVKDPLFTVDGASGICKSCHNTKIAPVLPVWKDFDDNKEEFAKRGVKGCIQCHMPEVERHLAVSVVTGKPIGEKRKGRSHALRGPKDAEFCGKTFQLGARVDAADVVVAVENRAGHRVPGSKYRKFVLRVEQLGADGKALATETFEIDGENYIKVLETRDFRFTRKDGATEVKVAVDHVHNGKKIATVKTETVKL